MFEVERTYPTAVTPNGAESPELAQRAAIAWIAAQQKTHGGTVLLLIPRKSDLDGMNNLIAEYAKSPGVVADTSRGGVGGWSGGPVLAAWPSREDLARIADDPRTRALCVIPWSPEDTRAWELASDPEQLGGSLPPVQHAPLDPVVIAGLTQLTRMVNHANNLAGSLDRRDAVAVLRTLHKGGYALPAADVYAWALANGWPARGAERLREMADKIDAGRTVQMKGASPLRADALERWRSEAGQR